MRDTMLELKNLKKHFGAHKAVDDISFSIKEKSIFGLLGPNGAGKTTLIRMITGIFYPDAGDVLFYGKPFNPEQHVSQIGYMPEERGLYKKMKIIDQVIYLARLKGMSQKEATENMKYWFTRLDMQSWVNKKVEDLSKGMSQKLQFVTTVMHNPKLIILDEPFSGLDPVNANLIKDEIFRLAQNGSTIIFSTHRMEQVEEICDHIVLINLGKKILDGTVRNIRQEYKEHVFSIKTENTIYPEALASGLFTVKKAMPNEVLIQVDENTSTNEVLQYFIQQNIIISAFNEELPTLNQIFIRLVEGSKAVSRSFETTSI